MIYTQFVQLVDHTNLKRHPNNQNEKYNIAVLNIFIHEAKEPVFGN